MNSTTTSTKNPSSATQTALQPAEHSMMSTHSAVCITASECKPIDPARVNEIFHARCNELHKNTDRMFAGLLVFEWLAAMATAIFLSPQTWNGSAASLHMHIVASSVLGWLLVALPLFLVYNRPGHTTTRHVVAVSQMLMSGLLIQVSGGRIETHFHVFGSLAFLAFYRDWRVLVSASAVVAVDHLVRGLFWPMSTFGILTASPWRALEHAAWVIFEDIFLIRSCVLSVREMLDSAKRQGTLEATNEYVESKVIERTVELKEARDEMRAMIESAKDGIITVSIDGEIQTINPSFAKLSGYSPEELISQSLRCLLPDGLCQLEDVLQQLRLSLIESGSVTVETQVKHKDGRELPVEVTVSEGRSSGDRRFFMGIVRDITERKEVERRVSEFYSTVSHELRTPVTSIRGALGLIEGGIVGEIPDGALEMVSIARSNCDRLIRLINDILDLRKIEAGKLELHVRELSAEELINVSVEGIQAMAVEAGVNLKIDIQQSIPLMRGDHDRVVQVLTNLLSNAIKFSPAQGTVTTSVSLIDQRHVRFSVTDEGDGIPEDQLGKLFSKFQQLDSSDSRPKGGTGLGLAISKAIVEKHGGTIGLDSEVGKGTTFWFDVPCLSAATKRSLGPGIQVDQRDSASPPVILLVDDDDELSRVLQVMIESNGYMYRRAGCLTEAEEVLKVLTPDSIILDLGLPDGDGLSLLSKLECEEGASIPVIVLTGRDREEAFSCPILVDWITKPMFNERLPLAIKRAVQIKRHQTVLVIEDDDVVGQMLQSQIETLGVRCLRARDGLEGVLLVKQNQPDLLVLDLGLPVMDGFDVVSVLKRGASANVPLILYTGHELSDDECKELSLGMTRCLGKSVTSKEEFLYTVEKMLQGLAPTEIIPDSDIAAGDTRFGGKLEVPLAVA